MQFAVDPAITKKIQAMQRRICWQNSVVQAQGIDQTHLVLDNAPQSGEDFSFLVIGDSGTGKRGGATIPNWRSPQINPVTSLKSRGVIP